VLIAASKKDVHLLLAFLVDANIGGVDLLFQLKSFDSTCSSFRGEAKRNKKSESLLRISFLLRTVTEGSLGEASCVEQNLNVRILWLLGLRCLQDLVELASSFFSQLFCFES
jgi:hypothetical protein